MTSFNPEFNINNHTTLPLNKEESFLGHSSSVSALNGRQFEHLNSDFTSSIIKSQNAYNSSKNDINHISDKLIQQDNFWDTEVKNENVQNETDDSIMGDDDDDQIFEDFQSNKKDFTIENQEVKVQKEETEEVIDQKNDVKTKVENQKVTQSDNSEILDPGDNSLTDRLSKLKSINLSQDSIDNFKSIKENLTNNTKTLSKTDNKLDSFHQEKIYHEEIKTDAEKNLSNLGKDYSYLTLESGNTLEEEIAILKEFIEGGSVTKNDAKEKLSDIKQLLINAKHADGTPLTNEEIDEIIKKVETAFESYISAHFEIRKIDTQIKLYSEGKGEVRSKNDKKQHFATDLSSPNVKIESQSAFLLNLFSRLSDSDQKKLEILKKQISEKVIELGRTIDKWKKERTERTIAYTALNIEDKIKGREIMKKELEQTTVNLQVMKNQIDSQRLNFKQNEIVEFKSVIESSTGFIKTELQVIQDALVVNSKIL